MGPKLGLRGMDSSESEEEGTLDAEGANGGQNEDDRLNLNLDDGS